MKGEEGGREGERQRGKEGESVLLTLNLSECDLSGERGNVVWRGLQAEEEAAIQLVSGEGRGREGERRGRTEVRQR